MDTKLTFIAMITGRPGCGRGGRAQRCPGADGAANGVGVRRPLTAPGPDQKLIPEENSGIDRCPPPAQRLAPPTAQRRAGTSDGRAAPSRRDGLTGRTTGGPPRAGRRGGLAGADWQGGLTGGARRAGRVAGQVLTSGALVAPRGEAGEPRWADWTGESRS